MLSINEILLPAGMTRERATGFALELLEMATQLQESDPKRLELARAAFQMLDNLEQLDAWADDDSEGLE
jgi:hypothetical protein